MTRPTLTRTLVTSVVMIALTVVLALSTGHTSATEEAPSLICEDQVPTLPLSIQEAAAMSQEATAAICVTLPTGQTRILLYPITEWNPPFPPVTVGWLEHHQRQYCNDGRWCAGTCWWKTYLIIRR